MRPWKTLWSVIVAVALSSWAGGAVAQGDDGGWYEESDPSGRPVLKIHADGPYDPPPADFRADDPAPPDYDDAEEVEAEDEEVVDEETEAQGQREAVREFSPHLAPYGHWVDDSHYGRIWVPARSAVGADFAPYVSAGRWELTSDDQWLWVSDYPFGWVTFHYGRWVWASGNGWGWVPGYRYAPAWVDFRIGTGGYVGWGPAAPYYAWRGGVFVSLGARRTVPYVFCPTTYVFAPTFHRHVIRDRYRVRSIASQTYRYRPQRVAGVYTRSPNPVQARIPSRALPSRRVVARPRIGDSRGNLVRSYSQRDASGGTRASLRGQAQSRRDVALSSARMESRRSDGRRAGAARASSDVRGYRSTSDRDVRRDDGRSRDVRRDDAGRDDARRSRDVRRDARSSWGDDARPAPSRAAEPRRQRNAESRSEPRRSAEPRAERNAEPRSQPRRSAEPRRARNAEPRREPSAEPRREPSAEPRREPGAGPAARGSSPRYDAQRSPRASERRSDTQRSPRAGGERRSRGSAAGGRSQRRPREQRGSSR